MKAIALLLFLTFQFNANAVNYYLSEKGNDNNNGTTKKQPWHSLKRLNAFLKNAQPNDSIFFERGSVFQGSLEISSPNLYLGAYGAGTDPIISGSLTLTTWVPYRNNIWKTACANCSSEINNLFIDGKAQPLGRFPNEGYLSISNYSDNENTVSDNTSKFVDGQWNNSEIVVRSSRWTIDNIPVNEYKTKTFFLHDKPSYPLQPGFGYFIQKNITTLDQHGEWFYNSAQKYLFVYFRGDFDPTKHLIEVSNDKIGLDAKFARNLTVENIDFVRHNVTGVHLQNCDNASLNNIEIRYSGANGLEIVSCKDPGVVNSRIIGSSNNGVDWSNSSGGKFIHNKILKTGVLPGRGKSGNGAYIAMYIVPAGKFSKESIIEANTIDSVGYSGIDFRTPHTQIRNNHISNFCLTKDDGGGVYTFNNAAGENIIEGNTIKNGVGSDDGAISKGELYASGIYIDDNSSQVRIQGNEVSNCSMAGIFIHNASDLKLFKNNLSANGNNIDNRERGQLYIKTDHLVKRTDSANLNIEVVQNSLVANGETSFCLFLSKEKKDSHLQIGSFRQNQFRAFHSNNAVATSNDEIDRCFSPDQFDLLQWQKKSQNEKQSTFSYLLAKEKLSIKSTDLITLGKPNTGLNDWILWPEGPTLVKENERGLSGTMKINIPNNINEALLYHPRIYLNKNKIYRLTFSAKSTKQNKLEFVPLMANSPWAAVGKYACFTIDSNYKTFTYYFKSYENNVEARVNFKSNSTFWIKDLTLFEVGKADEKTKAISFSQQ